MASHETVTDHERIRTWAESRRARPACVRGTRGGTGVGMIRLDFPDFSGGDPLSPISWDEWFEAFDAHQLALVIQETTADGQKSHFNTFVSRHADR